ncbi:MAG: hypothetical protein KDB24_16470, partial [Microthrixaceae bacterium]|nr:hypothetical protein [Microthrixaceae bacterium]
RQRGGRRRPPRCRSPNHPTVRPTARVFPRPPGAHLGRRAGSSAGFWPEGLNREGPQPNGGGDDGSVTGTAGELSSNYDGARSFG